MASDGRHLVATADLAYRARSRRRGSVQMSEIPELLYRAPSTRMRGGPPATTQDLSRVRQKSCGRSTATTTSRAAGGFRIRTEEAAARHFRSSSSSSSDSSVEEPLPSRRVARLAWAGQELPRREKSGFSESAKRFVTDDSDEDYGTFRPTVSRPSSYSARRSLGGASSGVSTTPEATEIDQRFAPRYLTFARGGGKSGGGTSKLLLVFDDLFWDNEANVAAPFFDTLREAYLAQYDTQEARAAYRDALKEVEFSITCCGQGLNEVERNLHRILTSPPGEPPLPPSRFLTGGGHCLPVSTGSWEDFGPSYYVVAMHEASTSNDQGGAGNQASRLLLYVSDCYESLVDAEDLMAAWMYLVRSAALGLLARPPGGENEPVVASLCCSEFVQFVSVSCRSSWSRGLKVTPVTPRLNWASPAHRHQILTTALSVRAWLRSSY